MRAGVNVDLGRRLNTSKRSLDERSDIRNCGDTQLYFFSGRLSVP